MLSVEAFALIVAVLSTGAVGVALLVEFSRISLMNGRHALLRARLRERETERDTLTKAAAEEEEEVRQRRDSLETLLAERIRLNNLVKIAEEGKVELVHELGDPLASGGFQCDLIPVPDFARLDPRKMIFARDIWAHRNRAHVWATSREEAVAALQRVFNERRGVLPGPLVPLATTEAMPADAVEAAGAPS